MPPQPTTQTTSMSTPQQGKRQRATDQGPSSHDTLQRKSTTEQNRRSVAQSQCAADGRGEQDENALPSVINADLLGKFLTDNTADMDTLLSFIEWLFSFSDEKIKRCLVSMFTGMANAISLFSSMKDEVKALNQGILAMKGQAEDYKEQLLYIEITTTQKFEDQIKKLIENYDASLIENARLEAEGLNKSRQIDALRSELSRSSERHVKECRALQEKLASLDALLQTAMQNLAKSQEELARLSTKLSDAERKGRDLSTELAEARETKLRIASQPGAPFYDPAVQGAAVCPVIQGNGLIVPLRSVIARWLEIATPYDAHIHRAYVCPVLRENTNLAPFAIQDRLRQIAQLAGIDTATPVVFSIRPEDGRWTTLGFLDQLKIIAHLCVIPSITHAGDEGGSKQMIIVEQNTIVIEIKAVLSQDGRFIVHCTADTLGSHANPKYEVKAVKNHHDNDPLDSMVFDSVFYP